MAIELLRSSGGRERPRYPELRFASLHLHGVIHIQPLRGWGACSICSDRTLKRAVNKVSPLRGFAGKSRVKCGMTGEIKNEVFLLNNYFIINKFKKIYYAFNNRIGNEYLHGAFPKIN
jgi:hypothetical protein